MSDVRWLSETGKLVGMFPEACRIIDGRALEDDSEDSNLRDRVEIVGFGEFVEEDTVLGAWG